MIKKILSITTWILTAVGLLTLLGFARYDHYRQAVNGIQIEIKSQDQKPGFLSYQEMTRHIAGIINLESQPKISDINIRKLESQLLRNPYIQSAAASTSVNRKLNVTLQERKAMMRVYTTDDKSYFIDEQGIVFPTHPTHVIRALIASGNIEPLTLNKNSTLSLNDTLKSLETLKAVHEIGTILLADDFMNVLIDQIYVTPKKQYELMTSIVGPAIILGDGKTLEQKISNVRHFYKAKAASSELHQYVMLNASYRNQIVCIKRDSL